MFKVFITFISVILCHQTALADAKQLVEADYILDNQITEILVDQNGDSTETTESIYSPMTEAGRSELVQSKVYFEPSKVTMKLLKMSVAQPPTAQNQAPKFEDQDVKTAMVKEVGIGRGGVQSTKAMVIPFAKLQLKGKVRYTYEQKRKPLLPKHFFAGFAYGSEFPEMKGNVTIRSKLPLYFTAIDNEKHLDITYSNQDGHYVLVINLKKFAYKVPKNEESVLVPQNFLPQVYVSSANSWNNLAGQLADQYEKALQKPLPQDFKIISDQARTKPSLNQKLDYIMNELGQKIAYAGDWSTVNGQYYPRGHNAVAGTKTGDCKDFATSMVGILRSLGFQSHVAFTHRSHGNDLISKMAPWKNKAVSADYFNHAIVYLKTPDNKELWLDPTNLVSDSSFVLSDILGSPALILDKAINDLKIVEGKSVDKLSISQSYVFRDDGSVAIEGIFELVGASAVQLKQMVAQYGVASESKIFEHVATSDWKAQGDPKFTKNSSNEKYGTLGFRFSLTSDLNNIRVEGKEMIYVPYPSRYKQLQFAQPGRVTDLFLGAADVSKTNTRIKNMKATHLSLSDCFVVSPWFDVKRRTRVDGQDLVVEDQIDQKVSFISTANLSSSTFKEFLSDLGGCLNSPVVVLKPRAEENDIPKLEEMTLVKALELVNYSGPDTYRKNMIVNRYTEDLLKVDPNNLEALVLYGRSVRRLGYRYGSVFAPMNLQLALESFNKALGINPEYKAALLARLSILTVMNQLDRATADLSTLLKIAPKDFKVASFAIDLAKERKSSKNVEAWIRYAEPLALNVDEKKDLNARKVEYYDDIGDHEKSISTQKEMIIQEPKNAWLLNNISVTYQRLERFEEAIDSAKKALEIASFGAASTNLASSYCKRAKKLFTTAYKTDKLAEHKSRIADDFSAGLKAKPNSETCLLSAGIFNEARGHILKEKDGHERAAEYFSRLFQQTNDPFDKISADAQKNFMTRSMYTKPKMLAGHSFTGSINFSNFEMDLLGAFEQKKTDSRLPASANKDD